MTDLSQPGQAGAQIEITPAMIEAGVDAFLLAADADDEGMFALRATIKLVVEAALAQRRSLQRSI